MVRAIRIHTTVESDTLRIPELAALVGKRVEIIVVEEDAARAQGDEASVAEPKRVLGSLRGLLHVPDDFDAPLPEELSRAFDGGE